MRRRRTASAIIAAPATRSRTPNPIRPLDSAATGRAIAVLGLPFALGWALGDADGAAPAASGDGVGVGAGGSVTVTVVGLRPCVGSDATAAQLDCGEYVGCTCQPSGAETSSTQYVAGLSAPATAVPLPSVAIVAITWPLAEPTWTLNVNPGAVTTWLFGSTFVIWSSPVTAGVGVGVGVALGVGVGAATGGSAAEMTVVWPSRTVPHELGVYVGAT